MRIGLGMVALLAAVAFTGWAIADDESGSLEDRVKSLEARLDALEKGGPGTDLRVRSLTVVDDEGRPRVTLGVDPNRCGVTVQDARGRERIGLGTDSHQGVHLKFRARTGHTRMSMALAHGDAPYIGLGSPNSHLRIEAPIEGAVGLGMWGGPGKQNETSHAGFWIWNDGTIAWGGGQRSAGRTGFHLKQTRDGEFDFVVRDHEERQLWEMPQLTTPTKGATWSLLEAVRSPDEIQRREGLRALTSALEGDDPTAVRRALFVIRYARGVEYDRAAMEPLVRAHLDSADPRARVPALWALLVVRGRANGDVESALRVAATDDFIVLRNVASPLLAHAQRKVEGGAVEAAFVRLLRHERIDVALEAAKALGRSNASGAAVQEALIDLWREHRGRYVEVLMTLLHVRPRRLPVVRALLEELSFPDVLNRHRAVVRALEDPETDEVAVETVAGAMRLLEAVESEKVLTALIRLIGRFGKRADADRLEQVLESVPLPPLAKRAGDYALLDLRKRDD